MSQLVFAIFFVTVQGKLSGFLRAMYVAHDRRKSSVEGRLDTGSIPGNHGIALLRQALDEVSSPSVPSVAMSCHFSGMHKINLVYILIFDIAIRFFDDFFKDIT